ncbi:Rhodanese-like protein [Ascodesmis nigricans]|uniref:M-phase inducer phosphatase n=1 Tax=Ascodesmis nigricans TaxID=341454 RepID=A0A4S2MSB2_9PEZI|nr:Rhodanese-like protein [Ascodesmis nigricans]
MFGPKLERRDTSSRSFFEMDSRMESSPTTSLVADLSQNFHIDKTPQIPTPRRSLFSGLQFGKGSNGHDVTTPPIPASSPGNESMDMSPLPHKVPYTRQMLKSPCADMNLCSSPPAPSPSADREPKTMDPPRRPLIADFNRKRAGGITRPGLTRNHRLSSGGISFKSQSSQPSFVRSSTVPQINLEELFSDASPERMKKQSLPDILAPPPPKFNMPMGLTGSPVPPMRSRSQRPKGKIRRTISMFEHAEDVMEAEKEDAPRSINPDMVDPAENYFLPSFAVKDDPLRRIERKTLCDVLDGKYKEHYDELIIVDCRFEYEYEGGHIAGAININTIDTLEEHFLSTPPDKRNLVIFHCEYSAHRAPRMALHLRKRDRHINMSNYPNLHYPNVYILQGGYSSFWRENKTRCDPQAYVEMDHADHKRTCEREMSRFRRNTKFGRAQTFTYGFGGGNDLESSPSATLAKRPPREEGGDTPLGARGSQRRMASY